MSLFSLSATVTIVCLYTPKLYIILLHPEKNIRQSMMNQSKYGNNQSTIKKPGSTNINGGINNKTILDNNGKNQIYVYEYDPLVCASYIWDPLCYGPIRCPMPKHLSKYPPYLLQSV